MAKIHHQTLKLATAHGLTIVEQGAAFEVRTQAGTLIDAALDPKAALASALALVRLRAQDDESSFDEAIEALDGEAEEELGDEAQGKSIIKKKYKKAYRPFKMTCGDELSQLISNHLKVSVKIDGKSVKRIDAVKLRKFAKTNGVWRDGYEFLNLGQQRMNVGNRLRKLVDGGYEVKWV